ncbi:MAG TPA: VOC family protein [Gammaproteobacteria bacterium]|nr:VOC family protein [Gammaproteobacteria bacterium]
MTKNLSDVVASAAPQTRDRDSIEAARMRRRTFLGALCAGAGATLLRRHAHGQARVLPLKNLGLEHLDIVVPDTAESARFYKRVFSSPLHEQNFRGGKRYFVLLGDLPADRQVGYIAIGAANGRPIGVGHYCALAESVDLDAIGKELAAAGYPQPAGGFGMIPDLDSLELQLFKPPAGLVTAATPSTLEVGNDGAFTPLGLDHVLLAVADRERALRYYRFLYGEGLETRDAEVPERVWFNLARNTRIGIEPAARGAQPRFVRFGIKVAPFDSAAVAPVLRAAGAEVLAVAPSLIRFRDNYGITLEVVAG